MIRGAKLRCEVVCDNFATADARRGAGRVKRDATLELGAEIVSYDRASEERTKIVAHLAHARGATLVPSFDDPWIIEGQGSAGIEAMSQAVEMKLPDPAHVVVPCGGDLVAGIARRAARGGGDGGRAGRRLGR